MGWEWKYIPAASPKKCLEKTEWLFLLGKFVIIRKIIYELSTKRLVSPVGTNTVTLCNNPKKQVSLLHRTYSLH